MVRRTDKIHPPTRISDIWRLSRFSMILLLGLTLFGCADDEPKSFEKAPRSVNVMTLVRGTPKSSYNVSGLVQSWKTEQLGFEVSGRVEWVLEPGKNAEGRIFYKDGTEFKLGTPLAKIDPSRYQVARQSALADLNVAKLEMKSIQVQVDETIPADINAALADKELAQIEFDRMERLKEAISKTEFDQANNALRTKQAQFESLKSKLSQTRAELEAAKARVERAKQNVAEADRNLRNTTLFGSYGGQISSVTVVPGSVVSEGAPVLTLQMMDPIKIEVEISAEFSRKIKVRHQLQVTHQQPDGTLVTEPAFVYLLDPSADPTTRTFTITLLLKNQKFRPPLPVAESEQLVARTQHVWPLSLGSIVGLSTEGNFMLEQRSIITEGNRNYVWLVTNTVMGQTMPPLLEVERVEVRLVGKKVGFLGNWVLQGAEFVDPSRVSPLSLIVGFLEFDSGTMEEWNGGPVFVDSGEQWLLRPGDLVSVNLSDDDTPVGYYVPIRALYRDQGQTSVFIVTPDSTISKMPVRAIMPETLEVGAVARIEPMEGLDFPEGTQIVLEGVHYLRDTEKVRVLKTLDPFR